MKAICYTSHGPATKVLTLNKDMAKPSCGPEEVLIDIHAVGINPVDWKIAGGLTQILPSFLRTPPSADHPVIIGMDASGVIAEIGEKVQSLNVGQEVYLSSGPSPGAMAEFVAVHESKVAPKPKTISHVEAASLPVAALTSLQALMIHADLQNWKLDRAPRVLILGGTTATGIHAVQLAHAIGAEVITTCSPRNFDWVKSMGANEVIDYHTQDIVHAIHGQTLDVIYDCVGGHDSWLAAQHLLPPTGHYVTIVGDEVDHHMTISSIMTKGWQMGSRWIGAFLGRNPSYTLFLTTSGRPALEALSTRIEKEQMKPVLDTVYALSDYEKAFAKSMSGRARGKLVIDMKQA